MDEATLGLSTGQRYPDMVINIQVLKSHMQYIPETQIRWDQVKNLYLIHEYHHVTDLLDMQNKGLELGFYTTPDHTWVVYVGSGWGVDTSIIWQYCKNIHLLQIINCPMAEFDLSGLVNLKCLRMSKSRYVKWCSVHGVQNLLGLVELKLHDIDTGFNFDLSNLRCLKKLELYSSGNQYDFQAFRTVAGIERLTQLEHLNVYKYLFETPLNPAVFSNLKYLKLHGINYTANPVSGFSRLTKLEHLELGLQTTGDSLDVSALVNLRHLILDYNGDLLSVHGLEQLKHLKTLSLRETNLREIPDCIRTFKELTHLNLSGMHLASLPDWLPELNLPILNHWSTTFQDHAVSLYATKVDNVEMSIFDQPQDVILQWFEARKQGNTVPLREVKVVFLGDGDVGKTHTITRLLNDGNKPTHEQFDGTVTPGIVIKKQHCSLDGQDIQINYWDFGGQAIFHSMHRMFLTERTLYVVLINARNDNQDERARYWLHSIQSFAGDAPVMLVLNKIDQNPNASLRERDLRRKYAGLKQVIRMSALEFSREQFHDVFTSALMDQVREMDILGIRWPANWMKLKSGLENMAPHYIHGNQYEELCENCGVEQNREELLNWFNDLGVSFCYCGSAKLEDYVILKPDWLTNAIYIILFNECPDVNNGVIPLRAINRLLNPPRKERDQIRRVLKDVFYDPIEADYVMDVVRKFQLSFRVRNDAEFIPMLCQVESTDVDAEYAEDLDTMEFRMTFDYLPENVIHRLMVSMRHDLDLQNVWRTGARFVQQGTDLSAVVRSQENKLEIFVRSKNDMHKPNTYLHIIKSNIERIVSGMNLQQPFNEVIYKTEDIREAFDYEDILNAQKDGELTYRSKMLRRMLPIQDILNQSGRTAEVELNQLRDDIITSCILLQGTKLFWDASEDELNTVLRDSLRSKDYNVSDQSYQGVSAGEKRAGELDLDIRRKPEIPWTICEALKIRDNSVSAWNSHLEKLLDNYNPSGLNYLFLLTYVNCDKDTFPGIWNHFTEHIRWYNPGKYERLPGSFSQIDLSAHRSVSYIRAAKCTYDRAGYPTTVCHIFVRIGR